MLAFNSTMKYIYLIKLHKFSVEVTLFTEQLALTQDSGYE